MNNKLSWALAFASIGIGVACFMPDFEITTIIFGFCIGGFVGYFVGGVMQAKGNLLQKKFIDLGDLSGKSLNEIIEKVGTQSSFSTCAITDKDNEHGFLYNWTASGYSITLLFDSEYKCIGVSNETKVED